MRRALILVAALSLAVLPAPAAAQSPAPSGPPSFEMAPGVRAEALAFLPAPRAALLEGNLRHR